MDPLAAAFCGLGAAVVLGMDGDDAPGAFLLFLGFYGVYRALRTPATKALIPVPALIWIVGHLWDLLPDKLVDTVAPSSSVLHRAPYNLSATLFLAALVVVTASARHKIGAGVSMLSFVALGIDLLFRLLPTSTLQNDSSSFIALVVYTETGWHFLARLFGAVCMVLAGVGPIAALPLPRRAGAIAGACGALLLSACVVGSPTHVSGSNDGILITLAFLFLVGYILVAVGLGAMARAGAKVAGWLGVGLAVFGILGLVLSITIFEKTQDNAYAFVMSTPFALLGIAIALAGWNGAPLELVRRAIAATLAAGFAGGGLAWVTTYLALADIYDAREPWILAHKTTEPIAAYGFAAFAALLVYLAWPPRTA